jgi:cytochrome o ubiquinol oxidase subunit 1
MGVFIAGSAFLLGFSMVWHLWWLVPVSAIAIVGLLIARSFEEETEYTINI